MAKILYLHRHGKARSTEAGMKDIDRELDAEGLRQCSRVGAFLSLSNAQVDAMISSHALRAIQSAEQVASQISYDISKICIETELYEASVRIILQIVNEFNSDWDAVLIVGHNPTITYFSEYLTGHHFEGMEPGSLVKITCHVDDWQRVTNLNASFEYYKDSTDLS